MRLIPLVFRHWRKIHLLLWLPFYFSSAVAQNPAATVPQASQGSDPQAVQLLSNSAALMGASQLPTVRDIKFEGLMGSFNDPTIQVGTFVAKARGEDWSVETQQGSASTSFRVLRGAGSTVRNGSKKVLYPSATAGLTLDLFPLGGRWTEFKEPGSSATIIGQSVIDGTSCYQIHVHSGRAPSHPGLANHHGEVDVFVDPASGLIAAIRYKATAGLPFPHEVEIENHFAHYDHFGSLLVPTEVRRYVGGLPSGLFRISSVSTNNGYTDADFKN